MCMLVINDENGMKESGREGGREGGGYGSLKMVNW